MGLPFTTPLERYHHSGGSTPLFCTKLIERIRLAGELPGDNVFETHTGKSLSAHLHSLKGICIHLDLKQSPRTNRYRHDQLRPTTQEQKFIHDAQNLVSLLTDTALTDAHLKINCSIGHNVIYSLQSASLALYKSYADSKYNRLRKLIDALPDNQKAVVTKLTHDELAPSINVVARRLLNLHPIEIKLKQQSLAMVQRLANVPALPLLFHNHYDSTALGADCKNDVRDVLTRLQTTIKRIANSPCSTDDNRNALAALSARIDKATSEDGQSIGRWRSPKQSQRILRNMIVTELRLIYRFVTPAMDRQSKRDRYSGTSVGHENEPTDTIAPTPFASISSLVLEHVEGDEISGDTLASIITHCCDIADPIVEKGDSADSALREAFRKLDDMHNPGPDGEPGV